MSDRYQQRFIFGLFFLTPMLYAFYTQHAWEDWYITYRASKNLAIGNGLVFQPGERLHTFTSPLGTLIPALLNVITGNSSDDLVLWLYRLVSSVFLGFSGILIWQIGRSFLTHTVALFALLALVVIDVKTIDNSINGMETALMVFFLALTLRSVIVPSARTVVQLGVALAGLMWSRPDGFIHATGFLLATIALPPSNFSRKDWFVHLLKAGVLGAVLYVPWLAWATWYYGSPIPNTIIAKGLEKVGGESVWSQVDGFRSFVATLRNKIREEWIDASTRLGWILTPTYYNFGGWPIWLMHISQAVSLAAMFTWVLPGISRILRWLSFGAFVSCLYLAHLAFTYPWYIPMGAVLCYFTCAGLLDWVLTRLSAVQLIKYGAWVGVTGLLLVQGWVFATEAYQMRVQQRYIEEGSRKQIGLWLQQHAAPGQSVFMECLGYIGFYSNMKTLDFPGLASKEVIEARKTIEAKKYPYAFPPLVDKLQPDWLVLRDYEIGIISSKTDALTRHYSVAKVFDVSKQIEALQPMMGYPYLSWDARFTVFQHNPRSAAQLSARAN